MLFTMTTRGIFKSILKIFVTPLAMIYRNASRKFLVLIFVLLTANFILLYYNMISFDDRPNSVSNGRSTTAWSSWFKQAEKNKPFVLYNAVKKELNTKTATGYKMAAIVKKRCATLKKPYRHEHFNAFMIRQMDYVTPEAKSLFCPVEKVASTFWRRFIYQVNHKENVKHPYQVSIDQALGQHFIHPDDNTTDRFTDDYFKFIFVRDPFHRILSAYIDKMFVPNPVFWGRYGQHSIKMFRKNDDRKCFHDATFPEFVQFVVWAIRTQRYIDPHFLPAAEMCLPCSMNYTYIGKMESFKDDAIPIFEHFGLQDTIPFLKTNLKEYSDTDAIADSIFSLFSWRNDTVQCMGWYEALLRVWRKLQMRGLIDMDQKYPLSEYESEMISKKDFLDLALRARGNSDKSKLRQQRADVFIEMYRSVPMNVLHRLRNVFNPDLFLFDFDPNPKEIFDRSFHVTSQNFSDFRI